MAAKRSEKTRIKQQECETRRRQFGRVSRDKLRPGTRGHENRKSMPWRSSTQGCIYWRLGGLSSITLKAPTQFQLVQPKQLFTISFETLSGPQPIHNPKYAPASIVYTYHGYRTRAIYLYPFGLVLDDPAVVVPRDIGRGSRSVRNAVQTTRFTGKKRMLRSGDGHAQRFHCEKISKKFYVHDIIFVNIYL